MSNTPTNATYRLVRQVIGDKAVDHYNTTIKILDRSDMTRADKDLFLFVDGFLAHQNKDKLVA